MKKLISSFLAVCSIAACFSNAAVITAAPTAAETDTNIASATFGSKTEKSNIKSVAEAGDCTLTNHNGNEALKIYRQAAKHQFSSSMGKIYIDLDDEFFCGNTDGSQFKVTVDYLDFNKSCFTIFYDSLTGKKEEEVVYGGQTNLVKSHTFILDDANFANGIDGNGAAGSYDIEIGFPEWYNVAFARTAYISGITVERIPAKYAVMAEMKSDVPGHIFNFNDVPMFSHTLTNYTDEEQTVSVTYTAEKKSGGIEWQETEELTFAPREVKTFDKNLGINNYGMYFYNVNISNDNFDYNNDTQFSYVNTAKDGLYNERFGYSSHIGIYPETARTQLDIMRKSNTNSIRDGFTWTWTENSNGIGEDTAFIASLWKEYDLDGVALVMGGNTVLGYTEKDFDLPTTDHGAEGFASYIDKLVAAGIPEDAKIELWNEPNLTNFAANSSGKNYALFATKVSRILSERYPDMEFGGLALCGIGSSETTHHTHEFTQALIDEGGFDTIGAVTMHPYYALAGPDSGYMIDNVYELVNMVKDAGYDVKIWNTEIGWTKGDSGGAEAVFTAREQSAYHQRYFVLWDEHPEFEYYFLYDFMKDGKLRDEREDLFGIIDNTLAPESGIPYLATEAYVSLTNMNNILAGAERPVEIETNVGKTTAYQYRNNARNEDILAFWRVEDDDTEVMHVNLGCNSVRFVDNYGNEKVLTSANGEYDIVPDFDMNYLIGNFGNVSIGPSNMTVSSVYANAISKDMVKVELSGLTNATSVEIEEDGFVEFLTGSEVVDGKVTLNIALPELRDDEMGFRLVVKNGEENVTTMRVLLKKSEVVNATLGISIKNQDYTNWSGVMSIKNNSERNVVDGFVNFKEFDGEKITTKKVYTGPILAGKTSEVEFNLPRVYERNLKELKYDLELNDGTVFNFSSVANFAFAPFAKTRPVIDGKWDEGEWEDNTYFEANQKSQIKQIKDWGGVNDLSATIYTAWDNDNFYITAKVIDDKFYQDKTDGNIWEGDSIQFGLVYGEETDIVIGNFGTKFTELGMAKTSAGDQMWRWSFEDDSKPAGAVENYELAIVRDESTKTTTYELALPWTEILPTGYKELNLDRSLGFSLLVNDNDGSGRRGWIEYASGIGSGKDTSLFTYLNLINVK